MWYVQVSPSIVSFSYDNVTPSQIDCSNCPNVKILTWPHKDFYFNPRWSKKNHTYTFACNNWKSGQLYMLQWLSRYSTSYNNGQWSLKYEKQMRWALWLSHLTVGGIFQALVFGRGTESESRVSLSWESREVRVAIICSPG